MRSRNKNPLDGRPHICQGVLMNEKPGDTLRKYRQAAGLTQAALARALGTGERYDSSLEIGARPLAGLSVDKFRAIVTALRLNADDEAVLLEAFLTSFAATSDWARLLRERQGLVLRPATPARATPMADGAIGK